MKVNGVEQGRRTCLKAFAMVTIKKSGRAPEYIFQDLKSDQDVVTDGCCCGKWKLFQTCINCAKGRQRRSDDSCQTTSLALEFAYEELTADKDIPDVVMAAINIAKDIAALCFASEERKAEQMGIYSY